MRVLVASLTAVVTLAAADLAAAADSQGRFAGHGWAVARCSELLETLRSDEADIDRANFVGWVAGYLSAANVYKDDTFDLAPLSPPEILANAVAEQCVANQDAAVVQVMVALARQLEDQRLRSSEPILTLEHDGQSVRIHREILRRTQEGLRQLGHYGGAVDGAFGPQTREALTSYQEQADLPTTGLPDQRTLLALFFNVVEPPEGNGDG